MDFFEHQERARRRTGLLVAYFVAAVVLIIVAVYIAIAAILFYGHAESDHGQPPTLWFPDLFAAVSLGTLAVITLGSLTKMAQLAGGGEVVARSLGARPVTANTRDLRERVLLNVVEEMAIASGTPVPPVFLLENEPGINAFAAGTTPQNAVITVTRGSLDTLSRDELQGVVAHEFSHILNGDMRLNIRLIGLLSGILLIATAGYILLRTTAWSDNRRSDDKKGGNPLPLLGLCLLVIGYIGVFFGSLIKSAVSRQREFLADASAVQFTRFPGGIAGALKKIGGLMAGSRLRAPNAEQAAHMYFSNGVGASFLQLMDTHPPLIERIRRIEPNFDGSFAPTRPHEYSERDLIDPRSLAARRATAASKFPMAGAAAAAIALEPAAAVAQIGAPRAEHLDYAADLVASLPPDLLRHVHDPLGAVATIDALLLSNKSDVRDKQLQYLATQADPKVNQETLRVAPLADQVTPAARLPLVSLALPALHALSPQQIEAFHNDAAFLIQADNKLSLFEYAVRRLVFNRLLPRLKRQPAAKVKYDSIAPLVPACSVLLSALARFGTHDQSEAARAFQLGAEKLLGPNARLEFLPREQCGPDAIDAALDQLAEASPAIEKRLIEASAACIAADGQVTVEEAELLRVVSDALGCPMPPLLGPVVASSAEDG